MRAAAQRRVVGLAHVGAVGADQVEMLAGAEPGAAAAPASADMVAVATMSAAATAAGRSVTRLGAGPPRRGRAAEAGVRLQTADRDAGKAGAVGLDQRRGDARRRR